MTYKYETHMHTCEASKCAGSTGAEMARAHKEAGYTGIFVTDHFFNGYCRIDNSLPWAEKVELFCKGYEGAKAEGDKIGLQVFFGFEYCVDAAEFLVYNLSKEWLLANPDIDKWEVRPALRKMHADGAFIVHAHPFREREFIQLYPQDVDAVEVFNAAQNANPLVNERGRWYAESYGLPQTAGSDSHFTYKMFGSGVESEVRFEKPRDYLELLKAGKLKLLEW